MYVHALLRAGELVHLRCAPHGWSLLHLFRLTEFLMYRAQAEIMSVDDFLMYCAQATSAWRIDFLLFLILEI